MTSRAARRTLALLAVAVAVAGCGVPMQTNPSRLDRDGVRVVAPVSSTSLPPGTPTRHVDLCLAFRDHLVIRVVELPKPLSVRRTLAALVDASRSDLPAGVRSAIHDANLAKAGATMRGVARVDLSANFSQIAPADVIVALAQIVCTLTSLPGIGQVRFSQGGKPIDVPRADSSLTNQPVSRYDYRRLLPES